MIDFGLGAIISAISMIPVASFMWVCESDLLRQKLMTLPILGKPASALDRVLDRVDGWNS